MGGAVSVAQAHKDSGIHFFAQTDLALTSMQGNAAFTSGDFELALVRYTKSIEIDPSDPAFYSNRAAALEKLGEYSKSLTDANVQH